MSEGQLDLLKGTLNMLLLKALSVDAKHGHEIMRWIRRTTDETFLLEEGAIYPALHRLEAGGFVTASWGVTENNRRAKYYRLTTRGKTQLAAQTDDWMRYVENIGKVLQATR